MSKLNKVIENSKEKRKDYTFGKVLSCNSDTGKAVVYLPEYKMQKVMMNKSGEILEPGDSVWIHCHGGGIASGYIAIRNGVPKPMGGGGGFAINNAVVMTEGQADTYAPNGEIINVDVNNRLTTKYANTSNKFIVNGNLAFLGTFNDLFADEIAPIAYTYSSGNRLILPTKTINGAGNYTYPENYDKSMTIKIEIGKIEPITSSYYANPRNGSVIRYMTYFSNNDYKCIMASRSGNKNNACALEKNATETFFTQFPNCGFVICAESINHANSNYTYGYITARIYLFLFDNDGHILNYDNDKMLKNTSTSNTDIVKNGGFVGQLAKIILPAYKNEYANEIISADTYSYSDSFTIPFSSQSEYDFAVSITQKTELPPSLR